MLLQIVQRCHTLLIIEVVVIEKTLQLMKVRIYSGDH